MLFWTTLMTAIIGLIIYRFDQDICETYILAVAGAAMHIISMVAAVIMIFVMIMNHAGVDAKVKSNQERYEALLYKAGSEESRDEHGILNKEIVDEIQDWNEDVTYYQEIQNDFWLGIFYPNIYDQFETIDYSIIKINTEEQR